MNMHVYSKCNVDRVGELPSNKTVWSDLKSFLSLIVNYVSISLHRWGGEVRETNYIYAIPCPTGPRQVPRSGSS